MNSDSSFEKLKLQEELRSIREELLKRAQSNAENQANKKTSKETCIKLSDRIKKDSSKKNKEKNKHIKHKKSDKEKHDESRLAKKHANNLEIDIEMKTQQKKAKNSSKSSTPELTRDDWMTSTMLIKTFSKNKPLEKKQCIDAYEPAKSSRELNPHWKDGGNGLPSFRKPAEDSEDDHNDSSVKWSSGSYKSSSRSWVKIRERPESKDTYPSVSTPTDEKTIKSCSSKEKEPEHTLTDQEMNELGAKIMKAEILNNKELADELRNKLNSARLLREQMGSTYSKSRDKHSRTKSGKNKDEHRNKSREQPHTDVTNKRIKNFTVDDRDDIKNKFERENKNAQTRKSAKEHNRFNEDMDDIFKEHRSDIDKSRQQEIVDHDRQIRKQDICSKCFDSNKSNKELIVSVGKHVYLALPWHEGLQVNQCMIIPMDHYACSTEVDEDVWEEIISYRKLLTKLFADRKQDVLFFETTRYPKKRPHMVIHCVPSSSFEMAPFYFKKAIQESEYEWSKNKQLVMLKDKNLRRSIPKGLPYFWVNFGMDYGFAHVIEDQERFPSNFAQEIIGGMLELDANKWRCPKQQHNIETRVKNLSDLLKAYDINNF